MSVSGTVKTLDPANCVDKLRRHSFQYNMAMGEQPSEGTLLSKYRYQLCDPPHAALRPDKLESPS